MQLILSNLYTISHNPITNTIHEESIDYSKKLLLYQMTLMMTLIYLKKKKTDRISRNSLFSLLSGAIRCQMALTKLLKKRLFGKKTMIKRSGQSPFAAYLLQNFHT